MPVAVAVGADEVVVTVEVTRVVVVAVVVIVFVVVAVLEDDDDDDVVAVAVDCDEVLGPSEQGAPYARIACASCAYVHPSLTLESEKPALHIMIPPKRSAVP